MIYEPFEGFPLGKIRANLLLWPFVPTPLFPVVGQGVGQTQAYKHNYKSDVTHGMLRHNQR